VNLNDGRLRARTWVQGEPVEPGTIEYRKARFELLATIVGQPELSYCHGADFEKATMYFDGNAWTAEFEAIVPEKV
jgi:hypothetical protein